MPREARFAHNVLQIKIAELDTAEDKNPATPAQDVVKLGYILWAHPAGNDSQAQRPHTQARSSHMS